MKYNNPLGILRYANSIDITNTVSVDYIEEDGRAKCTYSRYFNTDDNADKGLMGLLRKVLKMVAK